MPTLRYWDATANQYVALPGSYGQVYVAVAAAPPNASNPVIAPPMGALWVDTTATIPALATQAYFPPQTPPATGVNTFTDSAGEAWISLNGSAWRKCRDVLHARVGRVAAANIGNSTIIPFDTVVDDVYGVWSVANSWFTAPVAGFYLLTSGLQLANLAAGGYVQMWAYKNGVTTEYGNSLAQTGVVGLGPLLSVSLRYVAGDHLQVVANASATVGILGNINYCWATLDYLGSG
jgi:hypothetical protein